MLAYFLKVNVALVLFYAFYRLFFYKDTFFGWRRATLLCFYAVSAAYPLLNIGAWIAGQEPMVAIADLYAGMLPELTLSPQAETAIDWQQLIRSGARWLYVGVATALILRFLLQLASIIRLIVRCRKTKIGANILCQLPRPEGPFSFFRWIFVHPESHKREELEEIITHELTHARQWHSVDIIIGELYCIVCWFNPFAWLLKREVRTNLEYIADARVLATGYDMKAYQYHLLGLSHHKAAATIYNSFNVLPLKKRIQMMNKQRTKKIGRTKYLMFLPLAALLMIVSNIETLARTTRMVATEWTRSGTHPLSGKSLKAVPDSIIFQVVEEMPEFPGGVKAMIEYIGKNMKYPEDAKANGTEGRVIVEFVVNADGTISDAKIKRSVAPSLDAEALRVVNSMPAWKPGRQRGQAVRVKYTLPIMFSQNKTGMTVPSAADAKPDANGIYSVVEQMPEYPGGMAALMEYLSKNAKYPEEARQKKIEGRVVVQMIINDQGEVKEPKIVQGVDPSLDAEALRLVSEMPRWTPGKQKGKAIAVKYTIPVMFRL